MSANQVHDRSVKEINCYTLAKIVIMQTINIVYVPRPVSHFQIAYSDFSDLCESQEIELKELGICFLLPRSDGNAYYYSEMWKADVEEILALLHIIIRLMKKLYRSWSWTKGVVHSY